MTSSLQPLTGILILTMLAVLFSEDRRANKIRLIATGVGIQFVFALLLLKVPFIKETVALINQGVLALQKASEAGTSLVFGYLGGAPLPFSESQPGAAYVLAFQALPLALFISAFAALLYHWRSCQMSQVRRSLFNGYWAYRCNLLYGWSESLGLKRV